MPDRQITRDLPPQIGVDRGRRLPIRQAAQRLQHLDRRGDVHRHRRPATPVGNRSANISTRNSTLRRAASGANTLPASIRRPATDSVSRSSRSTSGQPRIPTSSRPFGSRAGTTRASCAAASSTCHRSRGRCCWIRGCCCSTSHPTAPRQRSSIRSSTSSHRCKRKGLAVLLMEQDLHTVFELSDRNVGHAEGLHDHDSATRNLRSDAERRVAPARRRGTGR
jgi:hypothetical protein